MKKLFAAIISLILCCTMLFAACGETPPEEEKGPAPKSIEISGMKTSFTFGESFSALGLNVVIVFEDNTTRTATSREYTVDSSAYDGAAVGDYTVVVKLNGTDISKAYTVSVRKTAGGGDGEEEPDKDVPLDLWILAGQSNAAGYSQISQKAAAFGQSYDYREYLRLQDERTASGFDVMYYGTADVGAEAQMPALSVQNQVGLGLGRTSDFIGPELGMAKGFADGNTGTKSAIVKYACGGTWLGDVAGETETTNKQYGGWSSPSIVAQSGVANPHKYCGLMYSRLLATVEGAIDAFEAKGYAVSIKGFVFMQGEADAGDYSANNPSKWADVYEKNLKLFISDLRNDVARIAKDEAVKTRPFIVGKINDTGTYGSDENEAKVRAAQESVAAADGTVFAVESNDLLIYRNGNCVGSDSWHFNAGDMFTLGQRFAKAALDALQ